MIDTLALIGFGEAATAFAPALFTRGRRVKAFDIKTDAPPSAAAKRAQYALAGVTGCATLAEALEGAEAALSLVTADQALAVATSAAPHLGRDAFWFDLNSVAPDTKRQAARAVEAAGGRYVDVAVMAPVHPARAGAPLLVSGPHAEEAADGLRALGFTQVRVVEGEVGRASAIKMIRSIVVKGMEALSAECVLAASRAGVLDEVLASLDASPPPAGWAARADYNLERMLAHGLRRAAEMEEVVKTVQDLGDAAPMARATVERQRALGRLCLGLSPEGLPGKIAAILQARREEVAA